MSVVVADLHSTNFSHTNNTFRRWMLFFNLLLYQNTSFVYRNKEHWKLITDLIWNMFLRAFHDFIFFVYFTILLNSTTNSEVFSPSCVLEMKINVLSMFRFFVEMKINVLSMFRFFAEMIFFDVILCSWKKRLKVLLLFLVVLMQLRIFYVVNFDFLLFLRLIKLKHIMRVFHAFYFQLCFTANSKGGLTQGDLYDTIDLYWFLFGLWRLLLIYLFILHTSSEETELILSFKNRIMQTLMQKIVTTLQFPRRIILKPNKSHTNRIIQIFPCKTAFTRNDLNDTICTQHMRSFKFLWPMKNIFWKLFW